jgi:hypothetical protein
MPLTQVQVGLINATGTPSSNTFLRGDGAWSSAGAINDIFYENGQTVSANYTITSNKNAMSAGPITVDTGVTVTIPVGSSWVIV